MSEMLPLFPLSTVLFPGMRLPLHIFEERYQTLVADLLAGPEPRRFGVIAIRAGTEVGADSVAALHEVGCVAVVRQAAPSAAAGEPGAAEAAAGTVRQVQTGFRAYLNALADQGGGVISIADLPDEPGLLSYVIGAAMIIDLPERQSLLHAPDAMARLRLERSLLGREIAILRATTTRPAPDYAHEQFSPN